MAIKRHDACCNLAEPQKYYAKFEKPLTKDHMFAASSLWNVTGSACWCVHNRGQLVVRYCPSLSSVSIDGPAWPGGRASSCSRISSSARRSSPASQSSPKPSGCSRIPPTPGPSPPRSRSPQPACTAPPRRLGSSPCLGPYLLPLHTTPGEGRGRGRGPAGTVLFTCLVFLSLFFLIDMFQRSCSFTAKWSKK